MIMRTAELALILLGSVTDGTTKVLSEACENTPHFIGSVPDNLKAAVTKSNRYEATLNERFEDFADHYETTILPSRAYRPRDKTLVEGAIKIMYTRIYAPLNSIVKDHKYFLSNPTWN